MLPLFNLITFCVSICDTLCLLYQFVSNVFASKNFELAFVTFSECKTIFQIHDVNMQHDVIDQHKTFRYEHCINEGNVHYENVRSVWNDEYE